MKKFSLFTSYVFALGAIFLQFSMQTIAQEKSRSLNQNQPVDFSRDIQPILSENCYFCHGQDANQRQSDLRLDQEANAKAVLTAGQSQDSDLYLRICSDDADERMPPPDSNRSLSKDQIKLIKRWIDQGAKWSQHWAYAPIEQIERNEINSDSGLILSLIHI